MSDMSTVLQSVHWATRTNTALLTVATAVMVWATWRHIRIAKRVDQATDRVVAAVGAQRLSQLADLIPVQEKEEVTRWPDARHP